MLLLLQLAAAADTVLVRNVPPARTAFEQIVFVAQGITSLLVLVLVAMTLISLLMLRAKADEVKDKLEELLDELRPMTRGAAAMYEDVREVAKNINEMVDESRDTVKIVNERVRKSAVTLSDRVDELSTIIGRVNASANRVASVATTTVAGIKFGARALGLGRGGAKKKKVKGRSAERDGQRRAERPTRDEALVRDERPSLRRRD
jgi:methyl-accepting chemotaxis protein